MKLTKMTSCIILVFVEIKTIVLDADIACLHGEHGGWQHLYYF